jgi:flagellin-like hook-associated protein FlgL
VQTVDNAKLGVQLSQQETAFNAALATTAKISQLSLLDYM